MIRQALFFILVLLLAASCKHDTLVVPDCEFPEVSFTASVFPLVQNNCTGCHSGDDPAGNTFITNYDEVKFLVDNDYFIEVIEHQVGYEPMPYNQDKLKQCQIDMLRQWLDDGAPNN